MSLSPEQFDPLLDMTPAYEQPRMFPSMTTRPREGVAARIGHQRWSQAMAHAPVAVRAPQEAGPGILQTGDIRSQHETLSSKGFLGPGVRADTEEKMGFTDHPVYGYLDTSTARDVPPPVNSPEDAKAHKEASLSLGHDPTSYGDLKFTLNDSVKDRTSVINGDSLMPNPRQPMHARAAQRNGAPIPRAWDHGNPQEQKVEGYIEAQIHTNDPAQKHSRIPLSDVHSLDIDHPARFYRPGEAFDQDLVKLGAQFQDKGVSVWHNADQRVYQPPLPFDGPDLNKLGFEHLPGGAKGGGGEWQSITGESNLNYVRRSVHQKDLP